MTLKTYSLQIGLVGTNCFLILGKFNYCACAYTLYLYTYCILKIIILRYDRKSLLNTHTTVGLFHPRQGVSAEVIDDCVTRLGQINEVSKIFLSFVVRCPVIFLYYILRYSLVFDYFSPSRIDVIFIISLHFDNYSITIIVTQNETS